ncbi:MAG: prolyl oligopeptidase family serine peptidase [Bryobacteraceae bacterium]|nr:prolyl oligopeptidase family serine peptidase [Bryobacteraceae bacterium]
MPATVMLLIAALVSVPLMAQPRLSLTVDEIMRGPGLYGHAPRDVRWSGDGKQVYFEWKQWSDALADDFATYVVNRDGTGLRKLSRTEAHSAPPASGNESRDRNRIVYTRDGDLFLYDRATLETRRLTRTHDAESGPRFTADGTRVAFMRGGNLYTLHLATGALEQFTDIRPPGSPPDPDDKKLTESQKVLKAEERALLETIDERARTRERRKSEREEDNPRKPHRLQASESVTALLLSPDETYVFATITKRAELAITANVPSYVTEAAYTEDIRTRTKVGEAPPTVCHALVDVRTGEFKWLKHPVKTKDKDGKEIERPLRFAAPVWSEEGGRLAIVATSADNKERWIFAIDPAAAEARIVDHDRDEAWINSYAPRIFGFLGDHETLYFLSERDGWRHLYAVPFAGGPARQLTSGRWEVHSAGLSRDRRTFHLVTSEHSLHERHVYTMAAAGGERRRLTTEPGNHEATLSPAEDALAVVHSYTNRPHELFLMDNRAGAAMRRVTTSPAPEFSAHPWLEVPIVEVPARDGARVPARFYKPANWKRGGPAVVFVHGAGYLQNVHRWWSQYAREFMFHHLLMERGYIVIDLDYRASAGYGRDWRTAIYRRMGGQDLDDQVDAARWLAREHGVDPKRIGIYGGSYGGFITLMALFTQPDVFAAGAALRPVTDWAHYNHGYTSNILNIPQEDLEAYKRSSPIYHAAGLKGALLICHGMVDVNVHFQDTVRLAQRLIELRKENWEVAIYPVEDHAFVQPASWADEYKRILKLFETHLKK